MTPEEAKRLAALPADQQKAIVNAMAGRVNAGWDKQWGALPLDEPKPERNTAAR